MRTADDPFEQRHLSFVDRNGISQPAAGIHRDVAANAEPGAAIPVNR
jgi:hypothetical protein